MAITPRFSANRFQNVLKSALGTTTGGVQSALSKIGAGRLTREGATLTDARLAMRKLQNAGEVENVGRAYRVMRQAESQATRAAELRDQDERAQRRAEFQKESLGGVVRPQDHRVSISEVTGSRVRPGAAQPKKADSASAAASISQTVKKPDVDQVQNAHPMAQKPLLDIPFD